MPPNTIIPAFVKRNNSHENRDMNYDEGLNNLQYFAHRFDKLLILDATGRIGEQKPLLNLEANRIKFINQHTPGWAEPTIQKLMVTLLLNRSPDNENKPPTGLDR